MKTFDGYKKQALTDVYALLAGGGHKPLSEFSMAHTHPYLPLTGGTLTGDLYINANLYGPARGSNPRNRYDAALYFFNCNSSTTSTYNFGLYLWNNEFQFTYRTSADNVFKGNAFTIQGSDGQVTFAKTPKVGSTFISLDGHTHNYLPLTGGTITGNIILKGGTSPDMTYAGNVHPYIRFDNSDSSLNISLIFTDYDSYRRPAGIKLVGNQGSEWFEAANIYATTFYGALSGNASTATALTTSAGSATLPIYFNGGKPVACTASLVFSNLSNSGNNISVTVAGQNRTLTVGYADTVDGYHADSFLIDRSGNYTGLLYDLPCKSIFSGFDLTDAPVDGWVSGIVLGSNWNSNHYQHYLVEAGSRWYATRTSSSGKMINWNTFAYLTDNVASATKFQTARKIWGQSFDGTGDVSGTLSGVANILFNANNTYDIGSNSAASRYIYTYWLGAKSGLKLELGANNSNFGLGLCIDTNLNVGIGINTPSYKLHVIGDIYTTTGFKKNGSSDSYVLLGGGGHKAESALSVANADTVDGFHYHRFVYNSSFGYHRNGPYYKKIASVNTANWTWSSASLIFEVFSTGYSNGVCYLGTVEVMCGHWNNTDHDPSVTCRWILKVPNSGNRIVTIKNLDTNTVDVYLANDLWDCRITFNVVYNNGFSILNVSLTDGGFVNLPTASSTVIHYIPSNPTYVGNSTSATNSDTLDGYHANGLLTALSNSNNGISITVGGTTKSVSNISVNYASSAGNADTVDGYHANAFAIAGHNHFDRLSSVNIDTGLSHTLNRHYEVNNATGTLPFSSNWHQVYVMGGDDSGYTTQICTGLTVNTSLYFRHRINTTWNSWRTILDSVNYNDYVPTKTGGGASGTWNISINGNAATASKLGTSTVGATNVPIYLNSGTPTAVNLNSTANNLINNLTTGTSTPTDTDYYVSQYVGGGTTTTTFHRRPHSSLYAYIKGKAEGTWGINITGNAVTATNADKVDGYHASSLWRSDGATWNPGANVSLNARANNQEWSFDIKRNGYTGCYWHVWDSALNSMLKVNADNGKVYAPYNFVGNLEGNASSASKWTTARKITLSGSVTGSVSIDGSGDLTLATTTNHTHNWANIEGKPSTFTPSTHTHSFITIPACSTLNINSDNFSVEYAGGNNSVTTKPSGVDAFGVMKLRTAAGWYGQIMMSTNTAPGIYYRNANGLTSSIGWIKLLDSSNSNVSGGGSAWGSSITVNINGTSKTLTIPGNPNTDYRVTQSETTTTNYKPLVIGYTNVSTAGSGMTGSVTNQVYLSNKFYVQPSTGNLYATTFVGSLSGNASTATSASKWTTARTLTLTGSVTGSASIDGSGNVSLATTTNHTHAYLPLSGGTMTGLIVGNNKGGSWISGRSNAAIYQYRTTTDDWHPVVGFKTKTGSWEFGNVGNDDFATFSWGSDSNYSSGTNATTIVHLRNTGGTIALTSEIPTKSSWNYDDVYSKLGHTHDDRYYTESEINSKLGAYLPLSGGTMTGNIKYTGKGTSYIGNGENDAVNGVGGALNNLVISSWYGVSFTTSCSGQTYTNKNAVSINCRNGYVYANTFVGAFSGNASSATNADKVDGYHASDLVKFYLSPMTTDASADSAKSWFTNTMPSGSGAIIYNVPGLEKTIIAGKSVGAYGHMLQLNYDDTYLRILRYYGGSWKSTDWEKISAGYADSAGNADTLDGCHASTFATAGHTHTLTLENNDGANPIKLAHGGKYKLTAGGSSIIFTLPTSNNVDPTNYYWANIKVSATSSTKTSPTFSKVMINTTTTSKYQLNVNGDSYVTGWSYAASGFHCVSYGVYFTHNNSLTSAGEIDITSANEFCWGSKESTLYFNYRAASRGTTVTKYIWNAGSKSTYASHTMGDITATSINASGNIYAAHFYENSDIRYKKVLRNLSINFNAIATLPLFDFEWIENNTAGTGTSALAVLQILPNLVSGTDKLTLDYGVLGTIAGITACKELVTLKSELQQLKEKVKLLEDKLRKYENI